LSNHQWYDDYNYYQDTRLLLFCVLHSCRNRTTNLLPLKSLLHCSLYCHLPILSANSFYQNVRNFYI
jgi:hypothetical protein